MAITDADDPLLYLERRAYLDAPHRALTGLDAARVTLAGAAQRMEAPPQASAEHTG